MAKVKYIFAIACSPPIRNKGYKLIAGDIPNLTIRDFDFGVGEIANYDHVNNPKGLFIAELDRESERESIREYVKSFYKMVGYPPMVEYGLVTKEEFDEIVSANINILPIRLGRSEPILTKEK